MHDAVSDIPKRADYVAEDACSDTCFFDLFFEQVSASYDHPEPDVGYPGGWVCEANLIGGKIGTVWTGDDIILTREQIIYLIGQEEVGRQEDAAAYALAEKRGEYDPDDDY